MQEVAPKKAKLQVAEREYNATLALLEEKRLQVRMLEEQLAELNAQLNDANKRKKLLEDEVELSTNKLARAEKLIGKNTRAVRIQLFPHNRETFLLRHFCNYVLQ